jgi:hypothetical protein
MQNIETHCHKCNKPLIIRSSRSQEHGIYFCKQCTSWINASSQRRFSRGLLYLIALNESKIVRLNKEYNDVSNKLIHERKLSDALKLVYSIEGIKEL